MIEEIYNFFNNEMLYLWVNIGVLPFWFLIVFFPQSHLCKYLATSILPIFILSGVYVFVLYQAYLISYDFIGNFNLYLGLNYVSELFDDELYLLLFWIHFVAVNLFIGTWILKDSQKLNMNKLIVSLPLITTYLIGPIGILLYWVIRIFYAKNFDLYN